MPASVQFDVVQQELREHREGQVQRDDITLLGIRLD